MMIYLIENIPLRSKIVSLVVPDLSSLKTFVWRDLY
jgi:hypothetical protein